MGNANFDFFYGYFLAAISTKHYVKCSKKYSKIFFKGLLSVKIEIEKLNLLTKHGFFDFKNRGTVHIFMKLTSMNAKYINPISGKIFWNQCWGQVSKSGSKFLFWKFQIEFSQLSVSRKKYFVYFVCVLNQAVCMSLNLTAKKIEKFLKKFVKIFLKIFEKFFQKV